MAVRRRMTKEERKFYEDVLSKAEPYTDDDPHWALDCPDRDHARAAAAIAKQFLKLDDEIRLEQEAEQQNKQQDRIH